MNQTRRVLIVDDKVLVRQTLRDALQGFDCLFKEAANGVAALRLLETTDFDVIFLDLKLPDLSGIEVLSKARKLRKLLGKVIILTGLPEPKTREEANRLGAFRYLTKNPLNWKEIRSVFAEAISDTTQPSRPPEPKPVLGRRIGGTPGLRSRGAERSEGNLGSRPRLLVLDDKQLWLDTIKQLLGNEFELALTISPEEAYKRVRKEPFALVVLDMQLVGGVSGLDVLSRMRKSVPGLRAIILTGHPDFKAAVESGKRGALDYVPKGELSTLTEKVKRILSERATPARVFLSYAKEDSEAVSRLYKKLMGQGLLPWMASRSIVSGKKWEPEIRKAIDHCDFFVFCFSPHSANKEGMIRKEVNRALDRQKGMRDDSIFFITARLADCEVEEPFNQFQFADLFKAGGFTSLLRALSSDRRVDE
ncbi:MAG TPA: response regulator [Thermoanaerobaculia bacterium]|nr:response regulator [Thermoanaerobaculia bacterium]